MFAYGTVLMLILVTSQEFMERKRQEIQIRMRYEAEHAEAMRMRPLEHRRAESARAREVRALHKLCAHLHTYGMKGEVKALQDECTNAL